MREGFLLGRMLLPAIAVGRRRSIKSVQLHDIALNTAMLGCALGARPQIVGGHCIAVRRRRESRTLKVRGLRKIGSPSCV